MVLIYFLCSAYAEVSELADESCESRVYRYFCFEGRMAVDKRVRVIWT